MNLNPDFSRPQAIERCAWYLRVSTPKQKLEHQREHVARYCEQNGITIPEAMRFEDKEKRHKSAKRQDFQRLLETVKAGQIDWILICSFDRWGVADVDEFFEFRRLMLKHQVQLWSVVDSMNLTGITEGDYFRIVAMAIGATKYVEQMAEKNILKMIEMAKLGWAATGNAPYGTDLVCYPIHDLTRPLFRVIRMRYMRPHLYRILWYTPESKVERNPEGIITTSHLEVQEDETTERMPPRDKKATGYRFEPTIYEERIKALNLLYTLYDSGMGRAEISRNLWNQGYKHYDKPFGTHGLEAMLLNPVYIGTPAWGKNGVGAYRIAHDEKPTRVKRKATDTLVIKKDEEQYILPLRPLFTPIVPPHLWQNVHKRLSDRVRTNPDYGKRRTRDTLIHPLNGKLRCPDCGEQMVIGSSMPAAGKKGKKQKCYVCGKYRQTSGLECYSNTLSWTDLDRGVETLLERVKGRLDLLTGDALPQALLDDEWAKQTELGKTILQVVWSCLENRPDVNGVDATVTVLAVQREMLLAGNPSGYMLTGKEVLTAAWQRYTRNFQEQTGSLKQELEQVNQELDRIADAVMGGIPSQTVRNKLNNRMAELEERKRQIEPKLVPLTAKADTLLEQLAAIRRTLESADRAGRARLLDSFVETVVPEFGPRTIGTVRTGKNRGKKRVRRGDLLSLEFKPRQSEPARSILPEALKVEMKQDDDRTDRGSSRRPA